MRVGATPDVTSVSAAGSRLDSWKEIAVYLRRGISTVQRWEAHEGLPVHRLHHGRGGSVYAYAEELDRWWQQRGASLPPDPPQAGGCARRVRISVTAAVALLGVLALSGAAGMASRGSRSPSAGPTCRRFDVVLPPEAPLAGVDAMPGAIDRPALALSPDGRRLVYVAQTRGRLQLYLRDLATGDTRPLPGTDDAHTPLFDARGEWVAFLGAGRVERVPVVDGALRAASTPLAEWNGGDLLPRGRGRIVTSDGALVWVREGQPQKTLATGFAARYLATGHLLYAVAAKLVAVRLDLNRVALAGRPLTIADAVRAMPSHGVAQFAVSADGTLVYAEHRAASAGELAPPTAVLKVVTNLHEELRRLLR